MNNLTSISNAISTLEAELKGLYRKVKQEKDNMFNSIVEISPNIIAIVQQEKFVFINSKGLSILNCQSLADMEGVNIYKFIDPEFHETLKERYKNDVYNDSNNPLRIKTILTDVKLAYLEITSTPFTYLNEPAVLFIGHDISLEVFQKEKIKEAEQRYKEIFDNSHENLFLLEVLGDSGFRVLEVNHQIEKGIGILRGQLVGKRIEDLAPASAVAKVNVLFLKCVDLRTAIDEEIQLDWPTGTRYYRSRLVPIFDENGVVCHINGICWDITEQKQLDELLKKKQRVLEDAQQIGKIGSWEQGLIFNQFERSDEVFRIYELDPHINNVSDEKFLSMIHPDDRDRLLCAYSDSVNSHKPFKIEYRLLFTDGRIKYILERCETQYDTFGKPTRSLGTVQDISEQKLAEQLLQEEQQLFNGGPNVAFKWNAAKGWPVEHVSLNVEDQFGYTPEDFTSGKVSYPSIIHPDDLLRVGAEVASYSEKKGSFFEQEYRIKHADGEYRWVFDFTVVVRDSNGIITHFKGYINDITDELKRQRELETSRNLLSEAEVIATVGTFYLDFRNKQSRCSKGIYNIFGLPFKEEAIENLDIFSFVHFEDIERIKEKINYTLKSKIKFDELFRVIDNFGIEKAVHATGSFMIDSLGNELFLGSLYDVSAVHALKNQVAIGEDKLRILIDNSPVGIFVSSGKTPLFVNKALLELVGITAKEEFLKLNASEFVHPDDKKAFLKLIQKLFYEENDAESFCQITLRSKGLNGKNKIFNLQIVSCWMDGNKYIQIFVIDITDEIEKESLMARLASDALFITQKSSVISTVKNELDVVLHTTCPTCNKKNIFKNIIKLLETYSDANADWGLFNKQFENLHPEFIANLKELCPSLTLTDIKHCACIRLHVDTKETARFFNVSPASIQTSRVRLKKKLNLPKDVDLRDFIDNI